MTEKLEARVLPALSVESSPAVSDQKPHHYSVNEPRVYDGMVLVRESGLKGPTSIKYWM